MSFKIRETTDYSLFDSYAINRIVRKQTKRFKKLKDNMMRVGWIPAFPLFVVPAKNGRLTIKAGHHRFAAAVELKIPVRYVVCNDNGLSIYDLESAGPGEWKPNDYLAAHAKSGDKSYHYVQEYCQKTGIGLSAAIPLFHGQTGNSRGSVYEKIKDGTFAVKDFDLPNVVADLVGTAKDAGFVGFGHRLFVVALSKVAKTQDIDLERLKTKMKSHPYLFQKHPSVNGYLEMLQDIYNRQRSDKVALAFLAKEAAQVRDPIQKKGECAA